MKQVFLDKMGVVGWDGIEPSIIASLLAGKAVLFSGGHGTAKTQISETISYSFLGEKGKRFRYFNCPIASQDELLGYPDLAAMKKGQIKYIPTPTSVWGGHSVLMDEINRASHGMQGKFMELALSGTVMGQDTGIALRFAAVNPPNVYLTTTMDMALLSRFSVIKVPSLKEVYSVDKNNIYKVARAKLMPYNLITEWKELKETKITKDISILIDEVVYSILENIFSHTENVNFSGRQANELRKVFVAFFKYYKYTGINLNDSEIFEILSNLTMCLVPEASDLVNSQLAVEPEALKNSIIGAISNAYTTAKSTIGSRKIFESVEKGAITPKEFQNIQDNIAPEVWEKQKQTLPKNKIWKQIDKSMKYKSLPGRLNLESDYDSIKEHVGGKV